MADIIDVNIGDQVLEVYWQDEVELNLDMNLMYIKSGQKEIQDYVDNVSKPEIDNYIKTEAKPIVSEVVNTIAEPIVNEYLENTTKPAIDKYVDGLKPSLQTYVDQAQEDANSAATSMEQAALSATAASNYASNASADAGNAAESAGLAANSAAAAKVSETNAKTSETSAAATKAEIEAIAKLASFGNIGDIKYTSRTDVPNGGAWCDGALYTKAQFPDVYQMLVDGKLQSTTVSDFDSKVSANGSCGFFGLDTGNERFKVPLLTNVYLKAGQAGEMFGAESLPNITGLRKGDTVQNEVSGAYSKGSKYSTYGTGAGNLGYFNVEFNASRSSSTYKDGAKVNPDHVTYRAYVVLYASAAEASVAQAAEFMTALGGKANADMDNLSAAGRSLASSLGLPSSRYINLTLGDNGASYTAPANGWFTLHKGGTSAEQFVVLYNKSCGHLGIQSVRGGGGNVITSIPVKKGDVVQADYSAKGPYLIFRFIYAEGENE